MSHTACAVSVNALYVATSGVSVAVEVVEYTLLVSLLLVNVSATSFNATPFTWYPTHEARLNAVSLTVTLRFARSVPPVCIR